MVVNSNCTTSECTSANPRSHSLASITACSSVTIDVVTTLPTDQNCRRVRCKCLCDCDRAGMSGHDGPHGKSGEITRTNQSDGAMNLEV